jgi:enamine deaminase RidA (YjgF/YER057c/UK114 family)
MQRKLISSGSPFESEIAYSRAVVQGDWIFVSGTTGFNYGTMNISDRIDEQCEQCLKNIEAALGEAGASLHDVVRVRYILPNVFSVSSVRRERIVVHAIESDALTDEPRYWFPAKRYGWGWGPPRTWQGWAVIVMYVAFVAAGLVLISPAVKPGLFSAYLLLLTLLLVVICWLTGEPPRWRWGRRKGG